MNRRIFHSCERHDRPEDNRLKIAWASWDSLYARGAISCHVWQYPRTSKSIGDPRALPYLKDILQPAIDQASDQDIVFFSNDDVYLHPELVDMLGYHCSVFGPCCSRRCEFYGRQIPTPEQGPGAIARIGAQHMGRDLFAATRAWWLSKWDELPDFILGASDFDLCLCAMIRLEYGLEFSRRNIGEHIHPAEIPLGYVAHTHHPPAWSRPQNVNTAPSQKWNRKLFAEWARQHLPTLKFDTYGRI